MRKTKEEKLITFKELDEIPEQRNRMFRMTFIDHNPAQRLEKCFQSKRLLKKYVREHPHLQKVKLYQLDVVRANDE